MTAPRIGIDLGTTHSLAAIISDGAPRVLALAGGETLIPSAVHVAADGSVIIGTPARAKAVTEPERTALSFKRDMGTDREYVLSGRHFTPVDLSALVLGYIKREAEVALGQPIAEAVVTVPAYFGERQRRATRDACSIAGLHVERIINEPTAAALAYGLNHRDRELRAVVVDLGGGTLDVTVLEIMEGVIEIQASAGDTRLGGEDFVDVLVAECRRRIQEQHAGAEVAAPLGLARLREACEEAKRRLSSEERARVACVDLPTSRGAVDVELELTEVDFEALSKPLLDRISQPIHRALRDASKRPDQIDEVLLVGGATRMPPVARLVAQLFGRLPLRALPPDEAVALGAAVQAALKAGDASVSDVVATDIAPFSLGIATGMKLDGATVTGLFAPIIERGTALPASRVQRFSTMEARQRRIEIEVFQGEHSHCDKNERIGKYLLTGIPVGPSGEEAVDVRFSYDMNGVLDVDATIVSTNKTATFTIDRSAGRLSDQELVAARERLARLKFHPRESLPNLTALARAEALYVELTGGERALLSEAIGAFRVTLEAQRPEEIERVRESLNGLVAGLLGNRRR